MVIIGLTGGIGSGKSFVATEFIKKGIPVYNSDVRAKELMETDPSIQKELLSKFGMEVFNDGKLNRKLIANQVFSNKTLITWLNSLVHPAVQTDFKIWLSKQNAAFVIKEAAILIESGAYKQCDKIIVVSAPKDLRIERVVMRDNMTPLEVENRINNQLLDSERLKYADFNIINDGTKLVSQQVENIFIDIINNKE